MNIKFYIKKMFLM